MEYEMERYVDMNLRGIRYDCSLQSLELARNYNNFHYPV